MTEYVLDASVLVKWFKHDGESHVNEALLLRQRYQAGALALASTPLLLWELVNAAARRWGWSAGDVGQFAAQLAALNLALGVPRLERVVAWTNAGLTAYDATYVARAEELGTVVVSDDAEMVRIAPGFTCALEHIARLP